ncbi:hypothetical protein OAF54_00680 [bacterium]|nr:hypothetical protein [bacterium]
MSERMANALWLAEKCWGKALAEAPDFVEQYLAICEEHLLEHEEVQGDVFRRLCKLRGLSLPPSLHHNTWVSGPMAMKKIGWITKIANVTPQEAHNHMPVVGMWKSNLFDGSHVMQYGQGELDV